MHFDGATVLFSVVLVARALMVANHHFGVRGGSPGELNFRSLALSGLMATSAILLTAVTCFGISDALSEIGGYLQ
jgi:hypothetical protein